MPSSKGYVRDYKQEYATESETRKRYRMLRNRARRAFESQYGNLPSGVDVDHVKPLSKGGDNSESNLRALAAKRNRSYPRTRSGRMR